MEQARATAPPTISAELEAFELELAKRFPGIEIRHFVMPTAISQVREIFIRELTTKDTIEAAAIADATMSPLQRSSNKAANAAEQHESQKLSIVGLGRMAGGALSYQHVNNAGIPLAEAESWPKRVWDTIEVYFNQVNGLPMDEVIRGIKEARTIGAFTPQTSGIPASASHGRPGDKPGANTPG